jgi:hypothetical protein
VRKAEVECCIIVPDSKRLWWLVFSEQPDYYVGLMSGVQLQGVTHPTEKVSERM